MLSLNTESDFFFIFKTLWLKVVEFFLQVINGQSKILLRKKKTRLLIDCLDKWNTISGKENENQKL